MRAFELDSALSRDPASEVLKHGGLHWGGSSRWWCRQKKRVLVQYLSEGLRKVWSFSVACLSIMFFAVKSRNFGGIICLLFTGRGFKNCFSVCLALDNIILICIHNYVSVILYSILKPAASSKAKTSCSQDATFEPTFLVNPVPHTW